MTNMTVIFVYNADSGLFNLLSDMAHKVLSPETYGCNLCRLTHGHLGMRQEWKRFLEDLGYEYEFLHRDQLRERYGIDDVALPAVFRRQNAEPELWLDAEAVNGCRSLEDLEQLLGSR